jgi:membrane protease YdiL (CAAX protease family)
MLKANTKYSNNKTILLLVGNDIFNDFRTNLFIHLLLGMILGVIYSCTPKIWHGFGLHSLHVFCIYA